MNRARPNSSVVVAKTGMYTGTASLSPLSQ